MWRSPGSTAAGCGTRPTRRGGAAPARARRAARDRGDRARHRADDPVRAALLRPRRGGHRADACAPPRPSTTIYTHAARPAGRRLDPRGPHSASATCRRSTASTASSRSSRACARAACCTCCPTWTSAATRSVFVPFYGVPAATVPSLSRFARLGRAKVVPVVSKLTPGGYDIEVLPAWQDFPTDDVMADTALMNQRLQATSTPCRRSTTGCTGASRRGPRERPPVY